MLGHSLKSFKLNSILIDVNYIDRLGQRTISEIGTFNFDRINISNREPGSAYTTMSLFGINITRHERSQNK